MPTIAPATRVRVMKAKQWRVGVVTGNGGDADPDRIYVSYEDDPTRVADFSSTTDKWEVVNE